MCMNMGMLAWDVEIEGQGSEEFLVVKLQVYGGKICEPLLMGEEKMIVKCKA